MKAHQRTIGKSDVWLTPPAILAALGTFDLDPCPARPKADGLACDWFGRVWCNPPFNRYERPKWMRKMAEHGNGIMLIPAATETAAFFDHVWSKADAVCFLRGRPHFHNARGKRAKANCGCSIVLVAYGIRNAFTLLECGLGKTLWLSK